MANELLQAFIEQEQASAKMRKKLISDIVRSIETATLPGVTPIAPNAVVVQASALGAGMILTPKYYIQREQAKVVGAALNRQKTCANVLRYITKAVQERKLDNVPLNVSTIKALRLFI